MMFKILSRWIVLATLIITCAISYKFLVGPIPKAIGLLLSITIPSLILPVIYLSQDWNFIQTTREGQFGEVNQPTKWIISFPGGMFDDINIKYFEYRLAYLNRWAIFTKSDSSMTFFYDRLTKKWYYHYYNQKSEELMATLKKAGPSK